MPGASYCMDCDVTMKNELEFTYHRAQKHVLWIKYKMEDNIQIRFCIGCDLTYECEDEWKKIYECENEFKEHYNQMHIFKCDLCGIKFAEKTELKDHIEDHHGSSLEPTVEESDDKHEGEASNKEGENDAVSQIEKQN